MPCGNLCERGMDREEIGLYECAPFSLYGNKERTKTIYILMKDYQTVLSCFIKYEFLVIK